MSLTVEALLERESITDAVILRHRFTDYMRDYEVILGARNGPPNTGIYKDQFVGCAEAVCLTKLVRTFHEPTSSFGLSLADEVVFAGPDYPEKNDPKGFIWGVRFAEVISGWDYAENGKQAKFWSQAIGRKMHEVSVLTNAYRLELVFADIRYSFLGYEPAVTIQKDHPLKVNEITSDGGVT